MRLASELSDADRGRQRPVAGRSSSPSPEQSRVVDAEAVGDEQDRGAEALDL